MLCLAACSKDYTYRIEGKLSHLTEPTVYAVFENEQEKKVDTLLCADNGTFELEEQIDGFHSVTLFFDGSYYQIGEGHKEYLADKWQDEDNYIFTLMGIARELNRESIASAKVYLAVGLPITWVGRQRESFRQYMLQRESVDFKYEDKLYSVRIIGCYVYPQGYAAVVEKLNEMTGLSMIADIGNGTVNIIFVSNRKVINTKTYTEKMGVNQCVKAASNAMMNKLGVTVDESIEESIAPIVHEIRKIGTNLNQLAYFSNIGQEYRVRAEIEAIRKTNDRVMGQLSDFLNDPKFHIKGSK